MKLPQADTLVSYCWCCRKYHGFETWCPFNCAKVGYRYFIVGVAFVCVAYATIIEWSVKLLLLALIGAFVYMAVATVLGWQEIDPVTPLLRSIQG